MNARFPCKAWGREAQLHAPVPYPPCGCTHSSKRTRAAILERIAPAACGSSSDPLQPEPPRMQPLSTRESGLVLRFRSAIASNCCRCHAKAACPQNVKASWLEGSREVFVQPKRAAASGVQQPPDCQKSQVLSHSHSPSADCKSKIGDMCGDFRAFP